MPHSPAPSWVCRNPGIDKGTLAGLIVYDCTTIGDGVDRLVPKGSLQRKVSDRGKLQISHQGAELLRKIEPSVEKVQERNVSDLKKSKARLLLERPPKATGAVNELSRGPMRPLPSNAKTKAVNKQPAKKSSTFSTAESWVRQSFQLDLENCLPLAKCGHYIAKQRPRPRNTQRHVKQHVVEKGGADRQLHRHCPTLTSMQTQIGSNEDHRRRQYPDRQG